MLSNVLIMKYFAQWCYQISNHEIVVLDHLKLALHFCKANKHIHFPMLTNTTWLLNSLCQLGNQRGNIYIIVLQYVIYLVETLYEIILLNYMNDFICSPLTQIASVSTQILNGIKLRFLQVKTLKHVDWLSHISICNLKHLLQCLLSYLKALCLANLI